jgi:hypothetical protein
MQGTKVRVQTLILEVELKAKISTPPPSKREGGGGRKVEEVEEVEVLERGQFSCI